MTHVMLLISSPLEQIEEKLKKGHRKKKCKNHSIGKYFKTSRL